MSITERKLKNGKIVYDNAFMYKGTRYKKGGFKTKREADDWEINIKYQVNKNGNFFQPCNKSFIEIWQEYYTIAKNDYSYSSIETIKSTIKIIKCYPISKKKLIDLRYKDVQAFFNDLGEKHTKATCDNVKSVFNNTFKFALQNDYTENNPMQYIKVKGKDNSKKKKKTITYEEFELLCNQFLSHDHFSYNVSYIALNIGYYTGARISEVLALSKNDIDFNKNLISFNKRLECKNYDKEAYATTRMKTKTSNDVVPLAEPLKQILLDWFEINPYDYICIKENGKHMRVDELQHFIRIVRQEVGIDFHFHMLRHTYASNLVNSGVNISVAKKLLRHANIQTTLDIYTHSSIQDEQEALKQVFPTHSKTNYPKITPKPN